MQRSSSRPCLLLGSVLAAMTVASCVEGTNTAPRIATLIGISGSGQTAVVGSNLSEPFVVRVEDQNGQLIEGMTVSWQVITGGGSISPSQTTSGPDGLVSATLRVGTTIGLNSARASLNQQSPVIFTATAVAAP